MDRKRGLSDEEVEQEIERLNCSEMEKGIPLSGNRKRKDLIL